MASLEKGTGFELKIAELFKENGYHVTHDIKMKGKSGAEHQIDVLAEYKAPLHTSTVIIEAKSYQANIDKDIVMKLIQIQQDLSADRAILVTTSSFTPGAISTADQYTNVELWDGEKIAKYLGKMQLMDTGDVMSETKTSTKKMVTVKVTLDQIKQQAQSNVEKRTKGGFMGRGKIQEQILDIKQFLYPYYDIDMEARIQVVEKTGWRSKEKSVQTISSRTGADAVTGALIDVDDYGIYYYYSYLANLNEDELALLYSVSNVKGFEKRKLSALGWSSGKIGKVVNSLCGKGVLKQINSRPATFGRAYKYPNDPSQFQSLMEEHQLTDFDSSQKVIEPRISPASIQTAFGHYWVSCKVNSIDLVYYPYYTVIYEREDGTKRMEVFDGITAKRQEYLEKVLPIT